VARHLGPIEVDRIFLYEENPRHEPLDSEPEVIEHLCKNEQVYSLARSISEAGTNPLALLGVVEQPGSGSKKAYQAWEGNRRVCAIKLLNDPDRAPADLRKDFARLAAVSAHVSSATYVERPCQASAFVRHFIQQERCGHMSGLSARS
jgi:hypothetical protein